MVINFNPKYIPGDIVYNHKKEIIRITSSYLKGTKLFYYRDGECGWIREDAIKPIPLTPEILEKNGWVKDTHSYCLDEMPAEAYEKKDFQLTYLNVTFGKKRIQVSHDSLFVRNLKYVSDLQHLLFGLGLNSEMEV